MFRREHNTIAQTRAIGVLVQRPGQQEIHYLDDQVTPFTAGNLLQRVIYHYWFHPGENQAIRQMLSHTNLPEFVDNIDDEAPYTPDTAR